MTSFLSWESSSKATTHWDYERQASRHRAAANSCQHRALSDSARELSQASRYLACLGPISFFSLTLCPCVCFPFDRGTSETPPTSTKSSPDSLWNWLPLISSSSWTWTKMNLLASLILTQSLSLMCRWMHTPLLSLGCKTSGQVYVSILVFQDPRCICWHSTYGELVFQGFSLYV